MRKLKATDYLILFSLCAVIFISLPLQVHGGVIGMSTGYNEFSQGPITDYSVSIEPFFLNNGRYAPFGAVPLSTNSIGDTEIVTSGQDFIGAIGVLTNGVNNFLGGQFFVDSSWQISEGLESAILSGTGKVNGIDFSGSSIDWMMLTINNYTVTALPTNFNHYVLDYSITYGNGPVPQVPEPATMLLLGSGLLGLCGARKKFKK